MDINFSIDTTLSIKPYYNTLHCTSCKTEILLDLGGSIDPCSEGGHGILGYWHH